MFNKRVFRIKSKKRRDIKSKKINVVRGVGKMKNNLGKQTGTTQLSNNLWIKSFEGGVKIRKKGLTELEFDETEIGFISLLCRKYSYPKMFTEPELYYIIHKFPETKKFIFKLINGELTSKEIDENREIYELKHKILKELEKWDMKQNTQEC
jgi:hypothetical protein